MAHLEPQLNIAHMVVSTALIFGLVLVSLVVPLDGLSEPQADKKEDEKDIGSTQPKLA